MKITVLSCAAGLIVCLLSLSGCTKPRSLEEIEAEQRALPVLYLTDQSQTRIEAPADAGTFVDEKTGEIAYRAYQCTNPDCPGRTAGGEPYLFIHRDVLMSVGEDGEFVWEQIPAGEDPQEYIRSLGGHPVPTCPKCLEQRNLDSETPQEKAQYQAWVQLYELPETAQKREELEAAYQEAFEAREKLRQGE